MPCTCRHLSLASRKCRSQPRARAGAISNIYSIWLKLNWKTGDASATLYTLIETAKANGLEPYRYLRYLFEHLPAATTDAQRKALLPQHLDPCSLIIPA